MTLEQALINFETPWLEFCSLSQPSPGVLNVTVNVLQNMGDDETFLLHIWHNLRDWLLERDQVKLIDKNCSQYKYILFQVSQSGS